MENLLKSFTNLQLEGYDMNLLIQKLENTSIDNLNPKEKQYLEKSLNIKNHYETYKDHFVPEQLEILTDLMTLYDLYIVFNKKLGDNGKKIEDKIVLLENQANEFL